MIYDHTICAPATQGSGAIAIIRVSGPESFPIVEKLFHPASSGKLLSQQPPNTIHYGTISNGAKVVDEVLVSLFKAPHSYTGEDSIEISCHGSPYIQQKILELLVAHGAKPAKAGGIYPEGLPEWENGSFPGRGCGRSDRSRIGRSAPGCPAATKRVDFQTN